MTARTPGQHEARRTAEDAPLDSRQVRRRLTFGVAADLADLPASLSPWQRALEAWRSADLTWRHAPPPESPAAPPSAPTTAPKGTTRTKRPKRKPQSHDRPTPAPSAPAKRGRRKAADAAPAGSSAPEAPPAKVAEGAGAGVADTAPTPKPASAKRGRRKAADAAAAGASAPAESAQDGKAAAAPAPKLASAKRERRKAAAGSSAPEAPPAKVAEGAGAGVADTAPTPKPAPAKRERRKAADAAAAGASAPAESAQDGKAAAAPAPKLASAKRERRKAAAGSSAPEAPPAKVAEGAGAGVADTAPTPKPAPAKRGRRKAADVAATEAAVPEAASAEGGKGGAAPAPKSASARRGGGGRSRRAARAAAEAELGEKVYSAAQARRDSAGRTPWLRAGIAAAAGLVLVAGGAIYAFGRGGDEAERPRVPVAVPAARMFPLNPAAKGDGLVQELSAVASEGGTVVAAGTESGVPGRERAQFLVSADAGRTWRAAAVRGDDGTEPPLGDRPQLLAGGAGTWVALGRTAAGGAVAWTGTGAGTWVRRPLGGSFTPADRLSGLVRTAYGFVAVGAADGRAVVWSTADGRAWQRIDGLQAPGITGLDRVAASGNVLVTHGTFARRVVRKKGRKKVTSTVRGDGLWRSADGGRTWTAVTVPQAGGSFGGTRGLVAGTGGFATVREGRRTTGGKKHRKTTRFGVLFTSRDGSTWGPAGQFGGPGFAGVERFGGGPAGLAVVVRRQGGGRSVLRSADGRAWEPGGAVGAADGPQVSGLAVAAGGAVALAGRQGGDAYLSGVDLRAVPGAVTAEREVRAVAAGPGRVVAVGSANGGTAVWAAPDGRTWARGTFPAAGGWLSDVAYGAQGWLAVGGSATEPVALASADGATWRGLAFPAGRPAAVTAGPAGYVVVGAGSSWRSGDLKGWRRTQVDGAPADVAATARGYVAVGGRGTAPAAWTSPDGVKWTPAKLPEGLGAGPLTAVAARGDALVAVGAGSAPLVSSDGGATWAARPGAPAGVSAVAATPRGFVVAGTAGERDAVLWASADGAAWRRVPARGLDGPGEQRLTALTAVGADLLAVGTSTDHRGETPLLWRGPLPDAPSDAPE